MGHGQSVGERNLVDGCGREITYLRVSVTDRCNFRCSYCMPRHASFLPKTSLLSFEDMDRICTVFIKRGIESIRLTGGEPLIRRGIMSFVRKFSPHLESGALQELTITTNGSRLAQYASELKAAGVNRINVSLDTLDADKFRRITRNGELSEVLDGIDAALAAKMRLKINTVALAGLNDDEFAPLVAFAHDRGMDITFIETMPVGDTGNRVKHFMSSASIKSRLARDFTLQPSSFKTAGPADYLLVEQTGGRVGFISPISHSFCATCDKVRLTCAGVLHTCLGHENRYDLAAVLRETQDEEALHNIIDVALKNKPAGHCFLIKEGQQPEHSRFMSALGG